jgi:peptidoglycan/LPS O-acetylase OafA/YrhL
MPVLLSHAGAPLFQGGFVGVDIFFVISGYLITGIILADIEQKRFSIVRFYERRSRRILPALFLVMFACLAAGAFLMSADAYQNLGQSVVATTLFSNNILLTFTSGYWDLESQFKPLLHTWSLGVEEQYYFIVPIGLILAHRVFPRHAPSAIATVGVLSFAICIWSAHYAPAANFYLLHTRAWELAAGGWAVTVRQPDRKGGSDARAASGLLMIAVAIFSFPQGMQSPTALTLLPVVGTVLVLMYCRSGLTHSVLTSRPLVGIGLISYSTYLWHQPLFAFLRVASSTPPPVWQFGLLILLSLALAWLSWRFVEEPFRNRAKISTRIVLLVLAPSAAVLVTLGAVLHLRGGLPGRFDVPPDADAPNSYKAFNMRVFDRKADSFAPDAARRLLVLGNSTARDFVNMAVEADAFPERDIVYRDDLNLCERAGLNEKMRGLVASATLIVLVYDHRPVPTCDGRKLAQAPELRGRLVFVGPKDFGANLNPVARIPLSLRQSASVQLSKEALEANKLYRSISPNDLYVDIIMHLSPDGLHVPIYDEGGRILSEDRVHVTRAGARFVGKRVFTDPIWKRLH